VVLFILSNFAQAGFIAYAYFRPVVILQAGMRQTNVGNDPKQALFMGLLLR